MNKIPTLFQRDPDNPRHVTPTVTPGCEWVLAGDGIPTRKWDGTCILVDIDPTTGEKTWWTRREVRPGKTTPPHYRPIETDPNTGKTFGWEPAEQSSYFRALLEAIDLNSAAYQSGTYELCGPKINGNPEQFERHVLIRHGAHLVNTSLDYPVHLTYDGLATFLHDWRTRHHMEGIVWHHPDGRMAKLKARDFPAAV